MCVYIYISYFPQPYKPDASPYGYILVSGSQETQGEKRNRKKEDKDEKEERTMKQVCSKNSFGENFIVYSNKNTEEKWVIESGVPKADASVIYIHTCVHAYIYMYMCIYISLSIIAITIILSKNLQAEARVLDLEP